MNIDTPRWAILRTSGARTLPLVADLCRAGLEAWSPAVLIEKRRGKDRERFWVDAPMFPSFAFLPSCHISMALHISADPLSEITQFGFLRHRRTGRIPLVSSAEIERLRAIEQALRDDGTRKKLKSEARHYDRGDRVRITEGILAGWTGIVEEPGKAPMVNLGYARPMQIEAWMLAADGLQAAA